MPRIPHSEIREHLDGHWILMLYDVKAGTWLHENGRLYVFACDKKKKSSKKRWCADLRTRRGRNLPNGSRSTAIYEVVRRDSDLKAVHIYGATGSRELSIPAEGKAYGRGGANLTRRRTKASSGELERGGAVIRPAEIANLLVRCILASRRPLTKEQWRDTLEHFSQCCAYCGKPLGKTPGKDHAVPINKKSLGEHCAGNVVPCCKECNSKKHSKDYREFLQNDPAKIKRIMSVLARFHYRPLSETPAAECVRALLNEAYEDVKGMARRYERLLGAVACEGDRK